MPVWTKLAAPVAGRLAVIAALSAAGLGAAGCGGAPPPTRSQAEAVAAMRSAQEVGAEQTPQAAYHLELAREQVRQAEALIERGRMDEAEGALVRAKADADLAIALSHEAEARETEQQLQQQIQRLEQGQR